MCVFLYIFLYSYYLYIFTMRLYMFDYFVLFMLFFIIPVGAVGAGMAAASGYYFGAQVLHLPISKRLTFNIVIASIGAFFLIKYNASQDSSL